LQQEIARKIREMQTDTDITIEEKRKKLIDAKIENERKEADSKRYALEATLNPYKEMDWKILSAINTNGDSAKNNIALAFRELAENSSKINNLNITPDLLQSLT